MRIRSSKITDNVASALADSSVAYFANNNKVVPMVTSEHDLARLIARLLETTQRVVRSSGRLYAVETDKQGRNRLRTTGLGEELLKLLATDVPGIKRHFPSHRLHPIIELLISSVRIPRHLDSDSIGNWTLIPRATGQLSRSERVVNCA